MVQSSQSTPLADPEVGGRLGVCLSHGLIFTVRNEVAKAMFLQAFVCPRGLSAPGGVSALGVSAPGGCLLLGGVCSGGVSALGVSAGGGGGCLLCTEATGRDGHCCGRYASYWNAFLFFFILMQFLSKIGQIIGWHSYLWSWYLPVWEILDPPLSENRPKGDRPPSRFIREISFSDSSRQHFLDSMHFLGKFSKMVC